MEQKKKTTKKPWGSSGWLMGSWEVPRTDSLLFKGAKDVWPEASWGITDVPSDNTPQKLERKAPASSHGSNSSSLCNNFTSSGGWKHLQGACVLERKNKDALRSTLPPHGIHLLPVTSSTRLLVSLSVTAPSLLVPGGSAVVFACAGSGRVAKESPRQPSVRLSTIPTRTNWLFPLKPPHWRQHLSLSCKMGVIRPVFTWAYIWGVWLHPQKAGLPPLE